MLPSPAPAQHRLRRALFLAPLAAALVACGGGELDAEDALRQGYTALGKGDGATALPLLERAASELATDPADPRWKEIHLTVVEAQARTDADKAKERFLALARSHRDRFRAEDFATVGNKLFQAGASGDAIEVVDAGIKEFGHGDDQRLHGVIRDIQRRAAQSNDASTLDQLRGLGYVGDDDEEELLPEPVAPSSNP